MTRRPTDLDTQQLTVDVLRSAAEELSDKRLALGMMGRTQAFLEGIQVGIHYLRLEAEHIEQENNEHRL